MGKSKKKDVLAPGKKAYALALEGLQAEYEDYSTGEAEDEDYTPGKQKKVAAQIAKLHNRLLKKSGLADIYDELDDEID